MAYIIVGLGNPGEEYEGTRHNTGRMMLYDFAKSIEASDFSTDKKIKALISKGEIKNPHKKGSEDVVLVAPETFMNNSGKSVGPLILKGSTKTAVKAPALPKYAEKLIVIYDDFNLPLGSIRVSFNRSSGGHNGLESIIKAVKTEAFVRIRVGVAPEKANGTAKVPHGEKEIEKFILSAFKPTELAEIKKVSKRVSAAIEAVIFEGREKAMSVFNAQQ